MRYYARYSFRQSQAHSKDYVLTAHTGSDVKNFNLAVYKKGEDVGKSYIRMDSPRSPKMKKYFAYTFEMSYNVPFTSTEALNENMQTFGDGVKLGSNDLILFQFHDDGKGLHIYFVKDKGFGPAIKKEYFRRWASGEEELAADYGWTSHPVIDDDAGYDDDFDNSFNSEFDEEICDEFAYDGEFDF